MIPLWLIKAGAVLVLLGGVWIHGNATGAGRVRAQWQAQTLADRQAAEATAELQRQTARAAATQYEAQRAAIQRRATSPSPESKYALHATICPPPGALGRPLELGDVAIDRSILDRLRSAGADY